MSNEAAPALSIREKLLAIAAQQEKARETQAKTGIVVKASVGRTADAFGSPIGAGTNAMHVVLAEAYAVGVTLTRKQIQEQSSYTNTPNHLNTMAGKGRVIAVERGQWRLSDAAGQHWHGEGKPFGFARETAKADNAPQTTAEAETTAETAEVAGASENAAEVKPEADTGSKQQREKGKRRGE